MFTLTLRLPHHGGDRLRDTTFLARKHDLAVRRFLDEIGTQPVAAITYTKLRDHTRAICTVVAYPERSPA